MSLQMWAMREARKCNYPVILTPLHYVIQAAVFHRRLYFLLVKISVYVVKMQHDSWSSKFHKQSILSGAKVKKT